MKLITALLLSLVALSLSAEPLVIAHRGASGYLPEHTLAGAAAAHAMGADYIEQDVVLTKDEVPIVLHDLYLDATTDVAAVFPGRAREDGHFYAIDFTLAEIKQLRVGERRKASGDAYFEDRFPVETAIFRLPTLEEELQLIQGLNAATGRETGIYVELKYPSFHRDAGMEIAAAVLQQLYAYGYRREKDRAYLQCFEAQTLQLLNDHTELRLVQLLRQDELTLERVKQVSKYADGVGPWIGILKDAPEFVVWAQEAGLEVHPFTFRADRVQKGFNSFEAQLDHYVRKMQINGLFTDHPDQVIRYLRRKR